MKYIASILMFIVLLLAGCGGGGGGNSQPTPLPGKVSISCTSLYNSGGSDSCTQKTASTWSFWPTAQAAVTIVNAGAISRSQMIEATITANNATANAWQGYFSMSFDAGCNGATTWEIAPQQPTPTVSAGANWTTTIGGQCSDMPLGQHTLTATLYDTDPAVVLDVVQVQFDLVN